MKMYLTHIAIIAATLLGACNNISDEQEDPAYKGLRRVTYQATDAQFANPERGFYGVRDFRKVGSPLSVASVKSNLLQNRSLFYLGFYLTDFMESDISADYLAMVGTSLQALREGGNKCIIRFAYKENEAETNKPWDASEEWVLRHIEQLAPVLSEYGDVIYVMQAGFVGVWGEWYYTDHFNMNPSKAEDYLPRRHVVDALLEALPSDRQLCIRTPEFKMKMFGLSLADTLTSSTAHNGTNLSRLAGHNDCFVASSSDYGTFNNNTDRAFWNAETRYTIMGGETCNVSKYCECPNTLKDMTDQHWSYLNIQYNTKVLKVWKDNNCFDEIERRLGYRLTMKEGYFSPEATRGGKFRAVVKIVNEGFAAPMNPRDVELVLVDADGGESRFLLDDIDPRCWYENTVNVIDTEIELPSAPGKYTLYLNLPDPKSTLRSNPLFSIRTANDNTWDAESGYNRLTEIEIK